MTINSFTGKYRWLSNFYLIPVGFEGREYPSVEHAYQAAKTLDDEQRAAIGRCVSPGKAKQAGRDVVIRKDWDNVKLHVMYALLQQKFQDKSLRKKLLDTGDEVLIEGNDWNDTFWGICKGRGHNYLGKLLMKVRKEIQDARRTERGLDREVPVPS